MILVSLRLFPEYLYESLFLCAQGVKDHELGKRRDKRQELQASADEQAQQAVANQLQEARAAANAEAAAEAAASRDGSEAAKETDNNLDGSKHGIEESGAQARPSSSPPSGAARMVKELRKSGAEGSENE